MHYHGNKDAMNCIVQVHPPPPLQRTNQQNVSTNRINLNIPLNVTQQLKCLTSQCGQVLRGECSQPGHVSGAI
jgi:hypothetical protein